MTLFRRVTEICRERLPSIRVARITIDSIYDLDSMLQPGIRFGVTVRNVLEYTDTPIARISNFFFEVDVMDGAEEWIIQKMSNWRNGTYRSFYRIFYKGVCETRLDGVDGVELGWRNAYDVFQLNTQIKDEWEKKVGVYNLTKNVAPSDEWYTLSPHSEALQYAPAYVPVNVRKEGLIITFRSYSEWETWQFSGAGDFIAADNWKRIDTFIEQGVYDMDQQHPLLSGQYYQCSNDDDDYYIPSYIPPGSRVSFMKVHYINSFGKRVVLRYALADLAYFHNYNYWDVLKVSDLSSADIEKMLTGDISSHTHKHLRDLFRLLYIGGEPPMEDVVTGEQYYDTVEDKIHTAINTEVEGEFLVWDIFGVAPKDNALYVSESDATYNTNRLWLYKEGYMRSLGIVQPQMVNAIEQMNNAIEERLAGYKDIYNLSVNVPAEYGYYTMDKDDLETPYAPDYVPVENRKVGLLITFMSYTGWQTWQYKGIEAQIGEVLEDDWLSTYYWKQKDAESLFTKAAIEEKLTGDIETHTHGHLNQLCELVAVRTSDPDITIVQYEQGAKYYNSHTNFIHTLDYSDMAYPWFNAEQPKVGVLYYSLSDESSSYAKLWRYTGTEMVEIPLHPSSEGSSEGSSEQDFSTKNLNVAGYVQVGSARIVYVPEDSGTPGYIKIQHADGSTAMHLITSGGQTMYSEGLPAEGGGGSATDFDAAQSDFLNLTEKVPPTEGYYLISAAATPAQLALNHVPAEYCKLGMMITFHNGSTWEVWQFVGTNLATQWTDLNYWLERKNFTLTQATIEEHLTGHVETHYHDTVQTGRVIPVTALSAPIARTFSLDPTASGEGYMIIPESYSFGSTITIELTLSYLLQARFYRYVLYIDMRHAGPLDLTITKNVGNIILKGDSTLNIALAKGIYKIEFIRQMSDVSNLVLYARHDFIPDDI